LNNSETKENTVKVEQEKEELKEKLNSISLGFVPKQQRTSKTIHVPVDLPNEKGIV